LLATTESSAKIVWRTLSQWQKWFSTRSACGKAGWQIFEILREFLQRFIGKNVSLAKNDKHAHSAWLIFKILRNRWVIGNSYLLQAESSLKIICRSLSHQQKLFLKTSQNSRFFRNGLAFAKIISFGRVISKNDFLVAKQMNFYFYF
jgi:hypothetical protein